MQELQNSLSGIAKLGRFGDDTLAHLSTGEMVIPPNTLDKKLQKQVQNDLAAKGVGIDRITVGSANNSINPQTGLPEFFSIKDIGKTLKGVGKGVKKFVKGATKKPGFKNLLGVDGKLGAKSLAKGLEKRVKDAAPYAVAVGLSLAPGLQGLGAVKLGALVGGVAGATDPLLKGKKAKDILKGGAIGAALGAAGGSIGKAATANKLGSISPQLKTDYLAAYKAGDIATANSIVSQNLGPSVALTDTSAPSGNVGRTILPGDTSGLLTENMIVRVDPATLSSTPSASQIALTTPTALSTGIQALDTGNTFEDFQRRQGVEPASSDDVVAANEEKSLKDKAKDYFYDKLNLDKAKDDPFGFFFDDLLGFDDSGGLGTLFDPSKGGLDPKALALATAYGKAVEEATERTKGGIKDVRTTIRPDLMPQPVYGSGGFDLGLGPKRKVGLPRRMMANGGVADFDKYMNDLSKQLEDIRETDRKYRKFLDTPYLVDLTQEELDQRTQQIYENDPRMFYSPGAKLIEKLLSILFDYKGFLPKEEEERLKMMLQQTMKEKQMSEMGFAKGGLAELDMRNGGDVNGPGTGTSDDIPAMLSDGEFVMTAKANNGAGGFKVSKTKTGIELLKNGSPDREMGAKNMMKLMRIFEGVA